MRYSIEIYVEGEGDAPEFSESGTAPYPVPAVGDYIHPGWRLAQKVSYYPGDRVKVSRVEHVFSGQSHTAMIHGQYEPGPGNPNR